MMNNVCKLFVLGYDLCIMKYHVKCNVRVVRSGHRLHVNVAAVELRPPEAGVREGWVGPRESRAGQPAFRWGRCSCS